MNDHEGHSLVTETASGTECTRIKMTMPLVGWFVIHRIGYLFQILCLHYIVISKMGKAMQNIDNGAVMISQDYRSHLRVHMSACYDSIVTISPWHPPCSVHVPDSLYPQSLSKLA